MRPTAPRPHTGTLVHSEFDHDSDYTYFSKPGTWGSDQLYTMPTSNDQGYFLQNSLEESIRNGSFSPTAATFSNPLKSTTNFEMKEMNKIKESLLKS